MAPDYILCPENLQQPLLAALQREITRQFGPQPLANPHYGKIINEKHFQRLSALLTCGKIAAGGKTSPATLQIEPTVLTDVSWEDSAMQEEIFGPILPIITYSSLQEALKKIESRPHPLALYLFSTDKKRISQITQQIRYGGGCINDTIMHLSTPYLPFGGIGESGMGCYHGKFGFETFSHKKSILCKRNWIDVPLRYQPYSRWKQWLLKHFLR